MLHRLFVLCIAVAFGYCGNKPDDTDRPVRNTDIKKSNSYSTLFTDSATLESFITTQHLNDTISHDMRVFYYARNFQFAWFSGDGITEQTFSFRSLYDYKNDSMKRRPLDTRLDNLMLNDSIKSLRASRNITKTELSFTWRFIEYLWDNYPNKRARNHILLNFVPSQKQTPLRRAKDILDDDRDAPNDAYKLLRKQLRNYVTLADQGGWRKIPIKGRTYRIGKNDRVISLVKKRLQITGDFSESDTSTLFTPQLENAIKQVQSNYGQTANGTITTALLQELNKPVELRIQQIIVNMERMRWQPEDAKGRMIVVNIPEFMLHVWRGNKKEFDIDVIVGKEGNSTIMFTGFLQQIVFNPYWNVPESIVRNEIMPAMLENPEYLAEHDMETTGEEDSLPVIRQRPGEKNELGKVKFIFPNSFDIYFHDTRHKELFKKTQRAYSHGCIRLADAEKLAVYLLNDNNDWPPEKIHEAMNSSKQTSVKIKKPIPVLISYHTVWVNEKGQLQFRTDIYGHDKKSMRKLFIDEPKEAIAAR